jgi:hypothetical protein
MNLKNIKSFAVSAREKLMEQIEQRAYALGITKGEINKPEILEEVFQVNGNRFSSSLLKHRENLIKRINAKGFNQVMEETSYIWFNRLIAIRYMEVNEYLPTGVRVLSSSNHNNTEPDIIREVLNVDLDLDHTVIYKFQDENNTEELYKYILVKQCNQLGKIMPVIFADIEDYTELLLPHNLLQQGSIIRDLVDTIEEEDWKAGIEIIGWLYQFYNSDKKEQVFENIRKNKKVSKEDIPAATQIFTPEWLVKYMVENSLGRLWLNIHEARELKDKWEFYIDSEKESEGEKVLNPEDIKFFDPCMGSGHILVYAFEVFYEIYKSEGYSERDISKYILEKNLYGLDIDSRAAQLTYFALLMKARSYNKRILREKIELNICSVEDSREISKEAVDYMLNSVENSSRMAISEELNYLIETFKDAKDFGSILEVKKMDFSKLEDALEALNLAGTPHELELQYKKILLDKLTNLIKQAKLMSMNYEIVVTNPPYMGKRKSMNEKLAEFLGKNYSMGKMDLFSAFILRNMKYGTDNAYLGFMTPFSWMFLNSFAELRKYILDSKHIVSLVQLEEFSFEEALVPVCSFILRNRPQEGAGTYIRLSDFPGASIQPGKLLEAVKNPKVEYRFCTDKSRFYKIPDYRFAYWISENMADTFKGNLLGQFIDIKQGMATCDNERFLRLWHEVDYSKIGFNCETHDTALKSKKKWFPYNKGGKRRKWFGNNEYVINWENNGEEVKEYTASIHKNYTRTIKNIDYYFKKSITWSDISGRNFAARACDSGFLFDVKGSSAFPADSNYKTILALLNSSLLPMYVKILNPTVTTQVGDLKQIPLMDLTDYKEVVEKCVDENIAIVREDWNSFETSWEFTRHPLLTHKVGETIEEAFNNYKEYVEKKRFILKANEEKVNEILAGVYKLQDEAPVMVAAEDLAVKEAVKERAIRSFISYFVGCTFGRYSLAKDGLSYTGEGIVKSNIIPITDEEYFQQDIVSLFVNFVKTTFAPEVIEENLDYIAEALGKKVFETSRQTIRRYFLKEFYRDHTKCYQKKTVYWMFDSGENHGFKALVYIHKYVPSDVAAIRMEYLHPLHNKYEEELRRIDIMMEGASSAKEKSEAKKKKEKLQKQIIECREYDEALAHGASMKIAVNLDLGVDYNYAKFQGIHIAQGEGKKPLKTDLLSKL